jgi:hypothetical protein
MADMRQSLPSALDFARLEGRVDVIEKTLGLTWRLFLSLARYQLPHALTYRCRSVTLTDDVQSLLTRLMKSRYIRARSLPANDPAVPSGGHPLTRRTLRLLVVLALSMLMAPLASDAQPQP